MTCRMTLFAILLSLLLGLSGCWHYRAGPPGPAVFVPYAPPPVIVVTPPPRPHPHAVWVPGRWYWDGHRYQWRDGHWDRKPRGKTWRPGHWAKHPKGWVWQDGRWVN